jgi:hypothetical protein
VNVPAVMHIAARNGLFQAGADQIETAFA